MPSLAEHECKRLLGEFLRRERIKRRMTLGDIAKAIGRSVSYVCDVESGRRGGSKMPEGVVALWADYLEIPIVEFATKQEPPRARSARVGNYMRILRSRKRHERLILAVGDLKQLLVTKRDHLRQAELLDMLETVDKYVTVIDGCLTYIRRRKFTTVSRIDAPLEGGLRVQRKQTAE